MNARERFINAIHFKSVDRVPYWVPWWWEETLEQWAEEGHPNITEKGEEIKYGCDHKLHIRMWLNFEPPFEEKVVDQDDEYVTIRFHPMYPTRIIDIL